MLETLNFRTERTAFTRSPSLNIPTTANYYRNQTETTHRNFEPTATVNEENWHEVLLTPENIMNIKKPLSPPKKREQETYASLQDFLLNGRSTATSADNKTTIVAPSTSPPSSGKSVSPEKQRWAGPAFCNSPAPQNLPKPSFYEGSMISQAPSPSSSRRLAEETNKKPEQAKQSPPKRNSMKSREEFHNATPTKKKISYVPKSKQSPSSPSPAPAPAPAPSVSSPNGSQQLEELSNHLKLLLNVKTL